MLVVVVLVSVLAIKGTLVFNAMMEDIQITFLNTIPSLVFGLKKRILAERQGKMQQVLILGLKDTSVPGIFSDLPVTFTIRISGNMILPLIHGNKRQILAGCRESMHQVSELTAKDIS